MKNRIILTLSLICISAASAFAQGDWSVGDQSYSPGIQTQATGIPSNAKLTVEGTYTWMSFQNFDQNTHGMQMTYELPACVIPSTGTPALFNMDRTPFTGVSFTPTNTGYTATFAPGTILPAATKLIFRISDLEIKDDQPYNNQDVKHSATFLTPTAQEVASNNSATISFNTFVVNGSLPIQLLDFKATLIDETSAPRVKLDWTTALEANSAYFIVQKSNTNVEWKDVAKLKAAGNSNTNIDYVSYDNEPYTGVSYYRLKQVDLDGESFNSKVRTVVWNADAVNVRLHPNPTSDKLNVILNLDKKSLIEVKISSMDGRVVQSITSYVEQGDQNLEMNLNELANGVYNISLYKNNQEYFKGKVQKQ